MTMLRLVYASRPFGFEDAILNGILADARRNNTRDGITGALVCRSDLYLQLLEGPSAEVEAAYGRITRDDRHVEIDRLIMEPVETRLFPQWAMRDDPARSWMWSPEQVARGAIGQATSEEVLAVFGRLAAGE